MSSRSKGSTHKAPQSDPAALVADFLAFVRHSQEWAARQRAIGEALLDRLRAAEAAVESAVALDGSCQHFSPVGEAANCLGHLLSEGIETLAECAATLPASEAQLEAELATHLRDHNADALESALKASDRAAIDAMVARVRSGEVADSAMRAALAVVAGYDRQLVN